MSVQQTAAGRVAPSNRGPVPADADTMTQSRSQGADAPSTVPTGEYDWPALEWGTGSVVSDVGQAQRTVLKDLILSSRRKSQADATVLSEQVVLVSEQLGQVEERLGRVSTHLELVSKELLKSYELNAAIGRKLGLDNEVIESARPDGQLLQHLSRPDGPAAKLSRGPVVKARVEPAGITSSTEVKRAKKKQGTKRKWHRRFENEPLAVALDTDQVEMVKHATKIYGGTMKSHARVRLMKTRGKANGGVKSQRWLDHVIKHMEDSELTKEAQKSLIVKLRAMDEAQRITCCCQFSRDTLGLAVIEVSKEDGQMVVAYIQSKASEDGDSSDGQSAQSATWERSGKTSQQRVTKDDHANVLVDSDESSDAEGTVGRGTESSSDEEQGPDPAIQTRSSGRLRDSTMKKRSAAHLDSDELFYGASDGGEVTVTQGGSAPVAKGRDSRLRTRLQSRAGEITGMVNTSGPRPKKRNVSSKGKEKEK